MTLDNMIMIYLLNLYRYKLFERKIRILAEMRNKDPAFDERGNFIMALKDSTLDEEKKCKLENDIQALLEGLENDTLKITAVGKETNEKINTHTLGKSHSYLPSLSVNVDIEFEPSRGRYAVANRYARTS